MFDNTKINEKEAEERPSRKKVEKRPRMPHFKTSLRRGKEEEALFLWRPLAKGREREREREGEKKM